MRTSAKDKKILAHLFSDLLESLKLTLSAEEVKDVEGKLLLLCAYCHVKPETVTTWSEHYFVDRCNCQQEVRKKGEIYEDEY
tara:strand:+ start:160 stop:405 length:246 start_codon:yes stop_codon:yes gene_type:complete